MMWVMQVFGLVRYTAPEISHYQLRTDGAKARFNKVQQIGAVHKMLDLLRSNIHVKWLIANTRILPGGRVSTGRVTYQWATLSCYVVISWSYLAVTASQIQ